jgi:hypothetical protein
MKLKNALTNPLSFTALALALSACGVSSLGSSSMGGGSGGGAASGSTGTGGGSEGTGGSTGTGGGQACGGILGQTCPEGQYCDYPDNLCGAADGIGVCVTPLGICDSIYRPVCGCDGTVYSDVCTANAAGLDLAVSGCTAPTGWFQCGAGFCQRTTDYCLRTTSDAGEPDSYRCVTLPSACGDPAMWPGGKPDCACLAGESCGNLCEVTPEQGLKLTCLGG